MVALVAKKDFAPNSKDASSYSLLDAEKRVLGNMPPKTVSAQAFSGHAKNRNHLSLLPMPAEDLEQSGTAAPEDFRDQRRKIVALKSWVMTMSGSKRGFVTDLSEGGALVGGVGTDFRIGERVLLKVQLCTAEAPVVVRCEVVRYQGCEPGFPPRPGAELGLRFVDVNLDEWFRLARHLDNGKHRLLRKKQPNDDTEFEGKASVSNNGASNA